MPATTPRQRRPRMSPLRRQALTHPSLACASVAEAVVQPVLAVVPELDGVGLHPVSAPEGWAGHLVRKAHIEVCHTSLEDLAAVDDLALARRPRTQLTGPRAVAPVRLGLLTSH